LLSGIVRSHILVRTGFSNEAKTKAKYRNTPNLAPDLRFQYLNIKPKIKWNYEETGKQLFVLKIANMTHFSYKASFLDYMKVFF
jgi:hypothetical protein